MQPPFSMIFFKLLENFQNCTCSHMNHHNSAFTKIFKHQTTHGTKDHRKRVKICAMKNTTPFIDYSD